MTTTPEVPQLLAFLLCEDILDQEGVVTLYRVVDTFNISMGVSSLPPEVTSKIGVCIKFEVFVRWGPGAGEFEQYLALVRPGQEEESPTPPQKFSKPEGFNFQQVRYPIEMMAIEEGIYKMRLYLNGEPVAENPFRVNITVTAEPGTPKQS